MTKNSMFLDLDTFISLSTQFAIFLRPKKSVLSLEYKKISHRVRRVVQP